jgi:hypothetical protein
VLSQTAIFDPLGLAGLAYWYGIWPLHAVVFRGLLRGLAAAAEGEAGATGRSAASTEPRTDASHRRGEPAR